MGICRVLLGRLRLSAGFGEGRWTEKRKERAAGAEMKMVRLDGGLDGAEDQRAI